MQHSLKLVDFLSNCRHLLKAKIYFQSFRFCFSVLRSFWAILTQWEIWHWSFSLNFIFVNVQPFRRYFFYWGRPYKPCISSWFPLSNLIGSLKLWSTKKLFILIRLFGWGRFSIRKVYFTCCRKISCESSLKTLAFLFHRSFEYDLLYNALMRLN